MQQESLSGGLLFIHPDSVYFHFGRKFSNQQIPISAPFRFGQYSSWFVIDNRYCFFILPVPAALLSSAVPYFFASIQTSGRLVSPVSPCSNPRVRRSGGMRSLCSRQESTGSFWFHAEDAFFSGSGYGIDIVPREQSASDRSSGGKTIAPISADCCGEKRPDKPARKLHS